MHTELSRGYPSTAVQIPPLVNIENRAVRLLASPLGELLTIVGLLLAVFGAFLFRLSSVVISDMDEGTYLYAGKLLAEGLTPYRDFLLGHPPLAVYMAAAWVRLAGAGVMAARMANLSFVLVSTVPLYYIVRYLLRSRVAGLLAIVSYTTGILVLANMGRTIKLEPLMNGFLIAAFAIYVLRPNSLSLRVVFGMLVAAAILVKLVAIIPIGLIVLADLIWGRRGWHFVQSWGAAALGGALILLPAAVLLLGQPHFLDDVLWSQLQRGGLPLELRLHYLEQDFLRYPPIPLALLGAAWFLVRERSLGVRVSSLVALAGLGILLFFFKTFFTYYIVLVMPWLAIVFVVVATRVLQRFTAHWRALLAAAVVVLGVLAPLGYDEYYNRSGAIHVSSPAQIIPILKAGDGYIYSMYPLFSLWSGRPEYPWYYAADALIPRINNKLSSDDFIQAFSGSQAVVLWDGELHDFGPADAYLRSNFRLAFQDAYYSVWTRDS